MMSESLNDLFAIFVREFATPETAGLGQESGQPIDVVVEQVESDCVVQRQQFTVPPEGASGELASGEVRVKFRTSNGTTSFRAQAIFKKLAEGTGFSGFTVRGRIRQRNETERVRVTGLTYRYNVWEWDKEFRC